MSITGGWAVAIRASMSITAAARPSRQKPKRSSARRHDTATNFFRLRTTAQVLGRYCVDKGVVYIPKSNDRARQAENAAVFDFALDAADLAELDALTTEATYVAFEELYRKCVGRGTPLEGTLEGVKMEITRD